MNRILGIVLLLVLIFLLSGGIFLLQQKKIPTPTTKQVTQSISQTTDAKKIAEIRERLKSTMVSLQAINDSREAGIAEFKEVAGKVEVAIIMTGGYPADKPQPAHIHVGACPGIGAIKYPLTNLVNGRSTTLLPLSLAQLQKQIPLAINIHKSIQETTTYVACGNIGQDPFTTSPIPIH